MAVTHALKIVFRFQAQWRMHYGHANAYGVRIAALRGCDIPYDACMLA